MRKFFLSFLFMLVLSSCGGGGGGTGACSSETSLTITSKWNSNGSVSSSVSGKVGVSLVATPVITGVPSSCSGQATFAVTSGVSLPAGLSMDTTTGVISGTPTKGISIAGPQLVTMQLPGYSAVVVLDTINIAP